MNCASMMLAGSNDLAMRLSATSNGIAVLAKPSSVFLDKRMSKIEYLLYGVIVCVLFGPGVAGELVKKILGL